MILKDLAPHLSLQEFVQCYRIVHFDLGRAVGPVLKAYAPRPEVCLHFFLREREQIQLRDKPAQDYGFPVVLAGQQTSVMHRHLSGREFITFNIIFQPTALFRLTGISAFELTNQYLDAELIFSNPIRRVLEQLQSATDYAGMITIADRFMQSLVARIKKETHQLDIVTRQMLRPGCLTSIDSLAKASYLSTKQFTRKFYERTGVNPKTYLRIVRFTKAIHLKNAFPQWDWLRIALDCDYFDYQHLVRDYKDFTQHTPTEYHLMEHNSPERKLGLTAELYKHRAAYSA